MTAPKLCLISSDADGKTDCTVRKQLLDFLPNMVSNPNQADAIITVVSWMPEYNFNPQLYSLSGKPVILLNYLEMGWDAGDKPNLLGQGNLAQFGHLNTPGYSTLDAWAKECPPRLTFMRELRQQDRTENIIPCEWLCEHAAKPVHTREQYDARAFEVFNCWGLSNPMRPRLHGEIFIGSQIHGYHVVDQWNQDQHLEKRNWVTIHQPWHGRQSMTEVLRWQRRAKISVSLFGAGRKSFRDSESPVDCLMARPEDGLAWSYPWDDTNSVQLNQNNIYDSLMAQVSSPTLYEKYLAGLANVANYRSEKYVRDWVMPNIERVL